MMYIRFYFFTWKYKLETNSIDSIHHKNDIDIIYIKKR